MDNAEAWELVICGAVKEHFLVSIEDPHNCTVEELKEKIEAKTNISHRDQILYFGRTVLEELTKKLCEYEGIKDGMPIYLMQSSIVIEVTRPEDGRTEEIYIPRNELKSWTIKMVRESVCRKFEMDVKCNHNLINGEKVIKREDDKMKVTECPEMREGCILIFTEPWVLVVCGDVNEHLSVSIEDSHNCTVKKLKEKIEANTKISHRDQILYCGETELSDLTKKIRKYEGLKNGMPLYLAQSNFVIKVTRPDDGRMEEISIPRNELESWTVKKVRESVCDKFEFDVECDHYLISGAKVIERKDDEKSIMEYPEMEEGCIFTPLKKLHKAVTSYSNGKLYHTPLNITEQFLTDAVHKGHPPFLYTKATWKLNICGDIEEEMDIDNAQNCTINDLKQKVQDKTHILVSNQTLYCEKEKLEHNDQKSLYVYPRLKNGAHITLRDRQNLTWQLEICGDVEVSVDIEDAHSCTVKELMVKVQQKTDIHVSEFTLYCGTTKLKYDDTNRIYVYPDLKNNVSLTLKKAWVLVICGDISDPFTLDIEDPKTCTVNDLKKKIQEEKSIPVSEQTLYCGKEELKQENDKHLHQYEDKGLKSGIAVCVKRSSIVITAQCTDNNGEVTATSSEIDGKVKVFIPRSQLESWTVRRVRECICHKFGFPVETKHYLISGKTVLKDDNKKITEYLVKNDDCSYEDTTLTFTPLKKVSTATPEKSLGKPMFVPTALTTDDLSIKIFADQTLFTDTKSFPNDAWKGTWSLHICVVTPTSFFSRAQIETQKTQPIQVSEHELTPVYKIRKIIQEHVEPTIPVSQQKLSIGNKVLNDWDDEGRPKLLRNYPSIHDGATINLTKVRQGKCIKVMQPSHGRLIPSKSDLIVPVTLSEIVDPPSSIIIYSDEMTLETFTKIVSNCEGTSSYTLYIQKRSIYGSGISEVKSMADIKDGCCVTTKQT